jgi:aspartyl protease family protein
MAKSLYPAGPLCAVAALIALAGLVLTGPARAAEELRSQIVALAAREGFLVSGLEQIEDAPAKKLLVAEPARQLEVLLNDYNYMLLHGAGGGIRELWILEPRPSAEQLFDRYAVRTTRNGLHHIVETTLVGPGGAQATVSLTLDTGATTIVLPQTLIAPLGFQAADLSDGWSRTVGGRIPVKLGTLKTVKVGHAMAKEVAVAFFDEEDADMELSLLGMSFLEHFRLTIEDAKDQIILMAK